MQRVSERDLQYDAEEGVYYYGGRPFTGVANTEYPTGSPMSETEYCDGLLSGTSRGWWESGVPEAESSYSLGALHGRSRSWHANGQLAEDEEHEYGSRVCGKKWDAAGALVEVYELKESEPAYQSLLRSRQAYGGHGTERR